MTAAGVGERGGEGDISAVGEITAAAVVAEGGRQQGKGLAQLDEGEGWSSWEHSPCLGAVAQWPWGGAAEAA